MVTPNNKYENGISSLFLAMRSLFLIKKDGLTIGEWIKTNFLKRTDPSCFVEIKNFAKKNNLTLSYKDKKTICDLIVEDQEFSTNTIDAKKKGVTESFEELIALHIVEPESKEIVKQAIKVKKENLDISFDELKNWVSHQKKADKIIELVAKAKKNGDAADSKNLSRLFLGKKELESFFLAQNIAQRNNVNLSSSQIKQLIQRELPVLEIIRLVHKLNSHQIQANLDQLLKLNTTNCNFESWGDILIQLFTKNRQALNNFPLLTEEHRTKIANIFLFNNRKEYTTALLAEDLPEFCYTNTFQQNVLTQTGAGFKLNIEDLYKIDNYVADVEKIIEYFVKCKEKSIKITWQEIAEMAQAQIQLEPFINALIQAQHHERQTG